MKNETTSNRIFGLDVMRAIAILMVLSSHILWIYPTSNGLLSQICSLFGFWGVEVFFVLSGYLIGGILYRYFTEKEFNFNTLFLFLKRRWFRTLPNYFLILILNIGIAYFLDQSIENVALYFVFLQNFANAPEVFFTESWSLSVEEFTYILIPIVLFGISFLIKKSTKNTYLFVIVLLLLFFMGTKINYYYNHPLSTMEYWNNNLKSVVIYRVDAILIGVLAHWISVQFEKFWKSKQNVLMSMGILLCMFLFLGVGILQLTIEKYPAFWNIWYFPITSICFALFLPKLSNWKSTTSLIKKPITNLSLISYAVYLLHYGVILQLMKHFVPTDGLSYFELHVYTSIYLILTFSISYFWYHIYEKPFTNLRGID